MQTRSNCQSITQRLRSSFAAVLAALGIVVASSSQAFAIDCNVTLSRVREENNGKLMAYFNSTWHVIANDTHPARADRLSMVMAALLSGRGVLLRYGSSYNCSTTDNTEVPTVVEMK
jgi:hypothetical protein